MLQNLFQTLYRFFMRRVGHSWEHDLECAVDIEAAVKKLKLDRIAEHSAKYELPRSNAPQPDGAERKISAFIQKQMAQVTHNANQQLIGYNMSLANIDLNDTQKRIRNLAENAKLQLNSRLAEAEQQLAAMKQDRDRNTDDYWAFRKQHQRATDAEYPQSRIYHYGLVSLILVAEALANGYFFARASEYGMLGGISQALILALLNIVPAFVFAGLIFLRYIQHVDPAKRLCALLAFGAYSAWACFFNLAVAHYRDLINAANDQPITQVLDRLIQNPFGLSDLNSWLLFIMGLFFAAIAVIDGYKSDDPYPAYGKLQRLNDELQELYAIECRQLAELATSIRDHFVDELERLNGNAKSAFAHLSHLAEAKPALVAKHKDCLEILTQAGDALIHHYRNTNIRHRQTEAPAYFNENWVPEKRFNLIGLREERTRVAEQKRLFASLPECIQKASNELELVYANFFDRLQRIEPSIHPLAARPQAAV